MAEKGAPRKNSATPSVDARALDKRETILPTLQAKGGKVDVSWEKAKGQNAPLAPSFSSAPKPTNISSQTAKKDFSKPPVNSSGPSPAPNHLLVDARAGDKRETILTTLQQKGGRIDTSKWENGEQPSDVGHNSNVGKLTKNWNPNTDYELHLNDVGQLNVPNTNHNNVHGTNETGKLHYGNDPVSPDVGEFTNTPKSSQVDARASERITTILPALQQGKLGGNKWNETPDNTSYGNQNDVGKLSKGWNPQDPYSGPGNRDVGKLNIHDPNYSSHTPNTNNVGKLHINDPVSPDVGEFTNNPKPSQVDARSSERMTTILPALQQGKIGGNKWNETPDNSSYSNPNDVGKLSKGWNPQDPYSGPGNRDVGKLSINDPNYSSHSPNTNNVGKLHINDPVSPDVGEFTNNPKPSQVDARASERMTTILPALQQGKLGGNKWNETPDNSSHDNPNDVGKLSKGWNPQDPYSGPGNRDVGKLNINDPNNDSYSPINNNVGKLHINDPVSPDVGEFTNNPKPSQVDARSSDRMTTVLPALQQGKIGGNKWNDTPNSNSQSQPNEIGKVKGWNPQDSTPPLNNRDVGKLNINDPVAPGYGSSGGPHNGAGYGGPGSNPDVGEFTNTPKPSQVDARSADRMTTVLPALQQGKIGGNKWNETPNSTPQPNEIGKVKGWNPQDSNPLLNNRDVGKLNINDPVAPGYGSGGPNNGAGYGGPGSNPDVGEFTNTPKPSQVDARSADRMTTVLPALQQGKIGGNKWGDNPNGNSQQPNEIGKVGGWNPQDSTPPFNNRDVGKLNINDPVAPGYGSSGGPNSAPGYGSTGPNNGPAGGPHNGAGYGGPGGNPDVGEFTNTPKPSQVDARSADRMTTVLPALQQGKIGGNKWNETPNSTPQPNEIGKVKGWNPKDSSTPLNNRDVGKLNINDPVAPGYGSGGPNNGPAGPGNGISGPGNPSSGAGGSGPTGGPNSAPGYGSTGAPASSGPNNGPGYGGPGGAPNSQPHSLEPGQKSWPYQSPDSPTPINSRDVGKLNINDPVAPGYGSGGPNNGAGYGGPGSNPDVGEFTNTPKPSQVDARSADRMTTVLPALQQGKIGGNKWNETPNSSTPSIYGTPSNNTPLNNRDVSKMNINDPVAPGYGAGGPTAGSGTPNSGPQNKFGGPSGNHTPSSVFGGPSNNTPSSGTPSTYGTPSNNTPLNNRDVSKMNINDPVAPGSGASVGPGSGAGNSGPGSAPISNSQPHSVGHAPVKAWPYQSSDSPTPLNNRDVSKMNINDPVTPGYGASGGPTAGSGTPNSNPQNKFGGPSGNHTPSSVFGGPSNNTPPNTREVSKMNINDPVAPGYGASGGPTAGSGAPQNKFGGPSGNHTPSSVFGGPSANTPPNTREVSKMNINDPVAPGYGSSAPYSGPGGAGNTPSSNSQPHSFDSPLSKAKGGWNSPDSQPLPLNSREVSKININDPVAPGYGSSAPHSGPSIGAPNTRDVSKMNINDPVTPGYGSSGNTSNPYGKAPAPPPSSSSTSFAKVPPAPERVKVKPGPANDYNYGYDSQPYAPQYQTSSVISPIPVFSATPSHGVNNPRSPSEAVKMSDFGRSGTPNSSNLPNYSNNSVYNKGTDHRTPGYDVVTTTTTTTQYHPPPQTVVELPRSAPAPSDVIKKTVKPGKSEIEYSNYKMTKGVSIADPEEDTRLKDKFLDFFDTSGNKNTCPKCGRKKTGRERFCPNDGALYNT